MFISVCPRLPGAEGMSATPAKSQRYPPDGRQNLLPTPAYGEFTPTPHSQSL